MDDRPTRRTYARIERERRFLLERLPAGIDPDDFERIHDVFIEGTHLRLRTVRRPDGAWIVGKLGQKIVDPAAPTDPRCREMTTIYLPEEEVAALAALSGPGAIKRRYKLREQGWTFCVDVWESPASARGTIVAEVEAPSLDELEHIAVPTWAVREVTDDVRYSAITLVRVGAPT
jgi:hypothetical protein